MVTYQKIILYKVVIKLEKLSLDIDRLLSELNKRNWSKTKLAMAMGCSRQRVSKIFSQPESATLQTVDNLARALDLRATELLWDYGFKGYKNGKDAAA